MFHNDYNEMCHPAVLDSVNRAMKQQMPGYGMDEHCENAAKLIRACCNAPSAAVHFMLGGTQTNLTVITAALRPHQAVISAQSAHIHVHETGAVEATGHKVIALPHTDGKILAAQIEKAYLDQSFSPDAEHIAQPKMVYISQPSEFGTMYSLAELIAISELCRKYGLYLFVDGARLGYGLAAANNDVTLADMAQLCDVFYIGGTKVGAIFGEAVVITNPAIAEDFRYLMKQRGGMLAKGWLLGLQFEALFENDLYFQIAAHADVLADQIRNTLISLQYPIVAANRTNQVFVTLPNDLLQALSKSFSFARWEAVDDAHTTVRLCTSWATSAEDTKKLCDELVRLTK